MTKLDVSALKLVAICTFGIILNWASYSLARTLNLSIYLDTLGTVIISVLSGYLPGIAVGFFTNLVSTSFDVNDMYYGLINILVACISTFFADRGFFKSFPKVLLIIPLTILVTSFFGAVIEELVDQNVFSYTIDKLPAHFLKNLPKELIDKSLVIMLAFLALKALPENFKQEFRMLGKMQAPLSPEMKTALNTKKEFFLSLRTKMVFNLLFVVLFVALVISTISYKIYQDSAVNERIRIADGIITMVVNEINPNRVDEYLQLGYKAEGYGEVERALYRIRASNTDIRYLYVYKVMEDGCHVIFDLDTASVAASEPGVIEEFDEAFLKYVPDLLAGKPIPPIINNEDYGYLLTIYKPVYNHNGQCVCYAGIDFSMDIINQYGQIFIARVVALFLGTLIFILALGLTFIENNIILPVNTMAYCARNFAYNSETARAQNVESIKSLEIKTNDEIENLYSAFLKTTEDSVNYFENLKRAEIQVAVMDRLAHKDPLTGMKNKVAYNEEISLLNADIVEGNAKFAIVMIDVNYLKRVNDTYGHEYGNIYLINAGKLACEVFGENFVYRIGGDEFVAILDGENVNRCEECVNKLRAAIEKFSKDTTITPWERVSAAVGVAYYHAGNDTDAEEVFKRADEQMYENKLAMKAARTD